MVKRIKLRTLLFGGIVTLLFLVLIGRIYYWQVIDDYWLETAKNRWAAAETLKGKRGTITDRNGNVLAMDTIAYNVSVNPQLINEQEIADKVTEILAETLGVPESTIREHVTARKEDGNYFAHREIRKGGWGIEKEVADQLTEARTALLAELREAGKTPDTGIYIQETLKRDYPRKTLASQLVGYISLDGDLKTGIEAYFDEMLSGEDGYVRYEKDGKRVQLANGEYDYKPPKDGSNIKLTIDQEIQNYVEEALRDIMQKYAPKSATAIAADPHTMEILAMANMPEYDPNEYWEYDYANYFNHAVGSLYEPGSTFKIATLAAAVEEGMFNPEETYASGSIRVPGEPRPIRDHNGGRGWGTISFLEGLKYSSNVAFVKLGFERLGAEKLRDYFTRFGFGQKTGIELTNELSGSIRFQYNREIADASYGQGVSVTAIQQVAAVAAVANGGKLLEPHIVHSITDPVTNTTTVNEPKVVRQVISEQTSRQVSEYLEQVVSDQEKGSGRRAYIEGYRVAGKTGTAQKWINGGYSSTKYLVSFIGYAPVDNPRIVVYIAVDEPRYDEYIGGGSVAAPAFREIVLKSLRKLGVAPNWEIDDASGSKEVSVVVPDVKKRSVAQAKAELNALAMPYELVGDGGTVLGQIPAPGSNIHPTQKLYLITEQKERLMVPDLTGVSLRDALELTSLIGARLVPSGSGFVVSQTVEEVGGERIVKVTLAPPAGSDSYDELSGEGDASEDASGEGESQDGQTGDSGEAESDGGAQTNSPELPPDEGGGDGAFPEGAQGGQN